ncbi:GAF domain-containing protein [Aureibacter tunicatorum]|uniref:GAF domain-containing protein n=1 Tax=Aureibacter tunicatorum TaxID=866807 RepID=A0AAE3XPP9_9BACT|nr:GAF domain-containing protein [Aureibacter tunicatorum]MDR6239029.1 hypothetical protein [Aureibacter tunicatorum]BDD05045.1 hypothetical protein AUTU_25280 [Aureibacter tunicatorum]
MDKNAKTFGFLLLMLFAIASGVLLYFQLDFSNKLLLVPPHFDLSADEIINNGNYKLYNSVVFATVILGLVGFVFFLLQKGGSVEKNNQLKAKDLKVRQTRNVRKASEESIENFVEGVIESIEQSYQDAEGTIMKYEKSLWRLCSSVDSCQAVLYLKEEDEDKRYISSVAGYALNLAESGILRFEFGESLAGQVAKQKKKLKIEQIPEGHIKVFSGLGESSKAYLLIMPIMKDGVLLGVLELASFAPINGKNESIISWYCEFLSEQISLDVKV